MPTPARRVIHWGVFCLWLLLVMEAGSALVATFRVLPIGVPSYSLENSANSFWSDIDPYFGVWHKPGSTYLHSKSCFSVLYQANEYGQRDPPRVRHGSRSRTLVIGDSFIEGWGVNLGQRFTDLLEKGASREHLNFGVGAHFSPTQYLLMYQHLASDFSHDSVVIGLLPENDFVEDDLEFGKRVLADRYRPYLVSEGSEGSQYRLTYFQPRLNAVQDRRLARARLVLRKFSYTYNLLGYLRLRLQYPLPDAAVSNRYSGYYDFTDEQFRRLQYVLEQFVRLADSHAAKVYVVSFPVQSDFSRYETAGPPPLVPRLTRLAQQIGFGYADLLAPMHEAETEDVGRYFLPCDGHWNTLGNRVAAEITLKTLGLYAPKP